MDRTLERTICDVIESAMPNEPRSPLDYGDRLDALGIDSLAMLVLCEALERRFSIVIHDDDVGALVDVRSVVQTVSAKVSGSAVADSVRTQSGRRLLESRWLDDTGNLHAQIELGMPLTGRNNLAEGPLLREVGHLRWHHMSALTGVPSSEVVDEDGERLYPTFFFVEIVFPPGSPMSSFGENDRFEIVSTLRAFGRSMLDGEHFLLPDGASKVPADAEEAKDQRVPYLRLSNSFVRQWQGAEWLKRSRVANAGFDQLEGLESPPDTFDELRRLKDGTKHPLDVPKAFQPLIGRAEFAYPIVPDRDLNGAGLLYFANFPVFCDIAERHVLENLAETPLEPSQVDRRTLVHRKSVYLGNAESRDVLDITVEAWLHNPLLLKARNPASVPLRLLLDYRIRRRSDGRLIFVSMAKKVFSDVALGDTPLLDVCRRNAPKLA